MYHIPNDKRATQSAEKISISLVDLIHQKDFLTITVKEITTRAHVGRATFYRLFDNPVDVLYYSCEEIICNTLIMAKEEKRDMKYVFYKFAQTWDDHRALLEAIIKISRSDILYDIHLKHIDEIQTLMINHTDLTIEDQEYMARLFSAILPVALSDAIHHPAQSPEQYYERLCKNIDYFRSFLKRASIG